METDINAGKHLKKKSKENRKKLENRPPTILRNEELGEQD